MNPHPPPAANGAGPAGGEGQVNGGTAQPAAGEGAGTKRAAEDELASPDDKRQRSQDVPAVAEHPAAMDSTADQTAPSFSGRAGLTASSDMQVASQEINGRPAKTVTS